MKCCETNDKTIADAKKEDETWIGVFNEFDQKVKQLRVKVVDSVRSAFQTK